jgi:16S rRNA (adenine1518-N6/adenine1519-N6)-dimethyltransferase
MELPFAKKSLGQHWLTDRASLEAMCDAAGVKAGDVVLEIGPGTGTLTELLLEQGARVIAVEKDENLAAQLAKKYQSHDMYLHSGDILAFDFTQLPSGYKVVANIP